MIGGNLSLHPIWESTCRMRLQSNKPCVGGLASPFKQNNTFKADALKWPSFHSETSKTNHLMRERTSFSAISRQDVKKSSNHRFWMARVHKNGEIEIHFWGTKIIKVSISETSNSSCLGVPFCRHNEMFFIPFSTTHPSLRNSQLITWGCTLTRWWHGGTWVTGPPKMGVLNQQSILRHLKKKNQLKAHHHRCFSSKALHFFLA